MRAAVVLRAGPEAPEAPGLAGELIAHVKALKGSVQTPKSVRGLTELPMAPVGKIDKKLRELRP